MQEAIMHALVVNTNVSPIPSRQSASRSSAHRVVGLTDAHQEHLHATILFPVANAGPPCTYTVVYKRDKAVESFYNIKPGHYGCTILIGRLVLRPSTICKRSILAIPAGCGKDVKHHSVVSHLQPRFKIGAKEFCGRQLG